MSGIEVTGLRKTFPGRRGPFRRTESKLALDGLSLRIPRGAVTGLLGLNGAGKTTTIKIIATLLHPSAGTVTVDGLNVVTEAEAVRRRINLIAGGERMVYARLTGRENLWYFGQLYAVPGAVLRRRIPELLALVGLGDAGATVVEKYSRGMVQRLSIARGLINDPSYLLLDEPTIGLDAPIARDLREVVGRLAAEGRGVLLTSHYLAEVEQLCDHVYVISDGRHLAEGSPAELMTAAGCRRGVRVVAEGRRDGVATALARFGGEHGGFPTVTELDDGRRMEVVLQHADDLTGALVSALVSAGVSVTEVDVRPPTLEDAVLRLADRTPASALRG
ncbi:ABC transporter ATP-binding protein [Nonomuraea sp. NPDC050404]|uniref:ABC transporter ATP-binding protein n=1 Tax=Nonomuraea sp. NPDC050404 TaxID=3155783 RepID=UPI0033FA5949